jgi:hypothetical protein
MGGVCGSSDMVGRVSARRPRYFLLLRQKKVPKEKASRSPGRCAVPCAARVWRGRPKLASLRQRPPFSASHCAAQPGQAAKKNGFGIGGRLPGLRSACCKPRMPWNRLCRTASIAPWWLTAKPVRGTQPHIICRCSVPAARSSDLARVLLSLICRRRSLSESALRSASSSVMRLASKAWNKA